ncbi:MAG: hypothetical protein KC560_18340, partial [Myxococcales bacterium]|nr:hypothetical protein [Myxococcales bacterium]
GEWGDAIALAERAHADATGRAAVPAAATLAWMRATAPDDALRDAARALEVARRPELASDPRLLEAAAAALGQRGAFDEAALALERAVALSREAGQAALADRWRRDLVDVRQRRAPIESATSARERVVSGAWSPVPEPIESLSTRGEPTGPARGSRPPLAR